MATRRTPTKKELRAWIVRVREDLRALNDALLDDAGDTALAIAKDLSGSAGELWGLVYQRYGEQS